MSNLNSNMDSGVRPPPLLDAHIDQIKAKLQLKTSAEGNAGIFTINNRTFKVTITNCASNHLNTSDFEKIADKVSTILIRTGIISSQFKSIQITRNGITLKKGEKDETKTHEEYRTVKDYKELNKIITTNAKKTDNIASTVLAKQHEESEKTHPISKEQIKKSQKDELDKTTEQKYQNSFQNPPSSSMTSRKDTPTVKGITDEIQKNQEEEKVVSTLSDTDIKEDKAVDTSLATISDLIDKLKKENIPPELKAGYFKEFISELQFINEIVFKPKSSYRDYSILKIFIKIMIKEINIQLYGVENSISNNRSEKRYKEDLIINSRLDYLCTDSAYSYNDHSIKDNASFEEMSKYMNKAMAFKEKIINEREALFSKSNKINDAKSILKLFYGKVLDKSNINISMMEGLIIDEEIKLVDSITQDFETFVQSEDVHGFDMRSVKEELEFAKEILSTYKYLNNTYTNFKNQFANEILNELTQRILEKVDHLQTSVNGLDSNVIIPGCSINHAVIFQIQKEPEGLFSFEIINTGDGAMPIPDALKYTENFKYTGVTKDQLTKCINEVLRISSKMQKEKRYNMQELNFKIANIFSDSNVHLTKGRKHRLQEKGTCAIRCYLSWLHGRIGSEIFRKFKPHMISQSIKTIEEIDRNLLKDHSFKLIAFGTEEEDVAQEIFSQMLAEGKKELIRYQFKAKYGYEPTTTPPSDEFLANYNQLHELSQRMKLIIK